MERTVGAVGDVEEQARANVANHVVVDYPLQTRGISP